MTPPAASPASDYRFLLLMIPSLFILFLAAGLFEFSSNITVDNFHNLTSRLMRRASEASKETFDLTHFLVEVKSRYIWLTPVALALVAGVSAFVMKQTKRYWKSSSYHRGARYTAMHGQVSIESSPA